MSILLAKHIAVRLIDVHVYVYIGKWVSIIIKTIISILPFVIFLIVIVTIMVVIFIIR